MVVSRQWQDEKGEAKKEWYFRHDKIMDFFLVQNFLGESDAAEALIIDRMGDPRFRSVYFLLATLLPKEAAKEIREKLIQYAADTKDHTVSNTFVQLLRSRSEKFVEQVLQQTEQEFTFQKTVTNFLQLIDAKIKLGTEQYLTIETIEGSLRNYGPLVAWITINEPNDQDIVQLLEISKQLERKNTGQVGLLFYRVPPDTTVRMEMAKVRLRDHFVVIPISLVLVEKALPNKYDCTGLLEEYVERYLQRADFFDDKNAISDTFSFFGRTELLQRLREDLTRLQGIGLFGLRKSGKTSVLIQLGFSMREHPFIHIDLQRYDSSRYGAALFNDIIERLYTLETESKLPQFEPFPQDKPAAELTVEFRRRVNELFHALQGTKYKLPILCFLDEIERIIPTQEDSQEKVKEFNACLGVLRVLSQEQRQLALLVADVHPDCNRINHWKQLGVPTNPVFSFFKEVFLPPFSMEETQGMLTNIGKLMGLEFDEESIRQIHQQSGGHPFVSRQLARLLKEKTKSKSAKSSKNGNIVIEGVIVKHYLEEALSYTGELKNYVEKSIWEDLEKRNFESAMAVLKVLACNEFSGKGIKRQMLLDKLKNNFNKNQCLDAYIFLTNIGLLHHDELDNNDFLHIHMPLL